MADTVTVRQHPQFQGPEFLVQNLLEAGIFAFITGSPGVTKTLVVLELAARLTQGKAPGDQTTPIPVIYVSIEGSFARSIGPRFHAAGGNISRFTHVEDVIWLPSQIDRLERLIRKHKARLVIIDPIKDHFDAKVYSDPRITTMSLRPIHAVAERTGCTILGVDWPSKSSRKGDLSVSGNSAFTGVPRQVIAVGRLSREEWVVGVTKANDSAALTGWIYGVEAKEIGVDRNGRTLTPRTIVWKRQAKPSEVLRAREQASIEEDPSLLALLNLMAAGTDFKTDDLLAFLDRTCLIGGTKKARSLLIAARDAGYLMQHQQGQGGSYSVTWTITAVGTLRLSMNEESVEEAIEQLFPSMTVKPLNHQLALPAPTRKRATKRAAKGGA